MPKVTAIVVGAGLSGLSAAYSLAKDGIDVLVVERGDYPGSKSVTGGRMYFLPVKDIFPELWAEAPWERHVVREVLTTVGKSSSVSIDFGNNKYREQPYHSYTVLASRFNKWFAQKAAQKGAKIISKYKVDDLILDNGKVKGVIVKGAKIEADVVIAADGIMSQVTEMAGLRSRRELGDFALGVKEVISVSPQNIESRLRLGSDEGMAQLFIGSLTRGMSGAGFLYTNRDSVSLGMVLGIKDMATCGLAPYDLLGEFKAIPEIASLISGGESLEYSAHVLSEAGLKGFTRLFGNGILVAGDAAGMVMNLGLTVRGMDFAIISGALAAETVKAAKKQNDFSERVLSGYQDRLKASPVMKDFETFRHAPAVLSNPKLFKEYPELVCSTMENLMAINGGPKKKLSSTVLQQLKRQPVFSTLKDLFGFRRM